MGRFNVAKAMQGGGGGIVNPAMDMGSIPTGIVTNYLYLNRIGYRDSLQLRKLDSMSSSLKLLLLYVSS